MQNHEDVFEWILIKRSSFNAYCFPKYHQTLILIFFPSLYLKIVLHKQGQTHRHF